MAQHRAISGKRSRRVQRAPPRRRQGFRQQRDQCHQAQSTKPRQSDKNRRPTEPQGDIAADRRRQQRRHQKHQLDKRLRPRRVVQTVEVTHNGAPNNRPGAGRQSLEKTAQQQGFHAVREGADQAGHDEQHDPEGNHGSPPKTVGQGAVDQLAGGQAEEKRTQRLLCRHRAGRQLAINRRQSRQIHINRRGAKGGQGAQRHSQAARRTVGWGHRGGSFP